MFDFAVIPHQSSLSSAPLTGKLWSHGASAVRFSPFPNHRGSLLTWPSPHTLSLRNSRAELVESSHFCSLGRRVSTRMVRLQIAPSLEFDHGCDGPRFFLGTLLSAGPLRIL
jgi:hypothetical protein